MRQFRRNERGSALWGKGSSGIRLRALVATVCAFAALAAPSTAFANDDYDAFLAEVYSETLYLDASSDEDVSWSDVSWSDVSWSDESFATVSWSD